MAHLERSVVEMSEYDCRPLLSEIGRAAVIVKDLDATIHRLGAERDEARRRTERLEQSLSDGDMGLAATSGESQKVRYLTTRIQSLETELSEAHATIGEQDARLGQLAEERDGLRQVSRPVSAAQGHPERSRIPSKPARGA